MFKKASDVKTIEAKKKDSKVKEPIILGPDDPTPAEATAAPAPLPAPRVMGSPRVMGAPVIPTASPSAPAPVSPFGPFPKAQPPAAPPASIASLKAAIAALLEHTPEHLTTLHGMSPEKHVAYTRARTNAQKQLLE